MKYASIAAIVSLMFIAGCQSPPKPQPAVTQPMSADAIASLQRSFQVSDAGARVGGVVEVLAESMYLRVDAAAADFPVGSTVAVIDSRRSVIAHGTVVKTTDTGAQVHYELASGGRAPMIGDAVVRFSE